METEAEVTSSGPDSGHRGARRRSRAGSRCSTSSSGAKSHGWVLRVFLDKPGTAVATGEAGTRADGQRHASRTASR